MKATIETQVCRECKVEKPLSEYRFRKDTQKHDRLCKTCTSIRRKAHYRADPKRYHVQETAYREANREKTRAQGKAYYQANAEKVKTRTNAWKKTNKEKNRAIAKAYREANREKVRSARRKWQKATPEKCLAKSARRRAAKLNATPAWANLKKIEELYLNCPPGHQVDHYFPLQSPIMCGLHVENNLQYLPAKDNISKGNRVNLEQQLNG